MMGLPNIGALDEHVRLADGIGLFVELLAVNLELGVRVHGAAGLARDGAHAARARATDVECTDGAALRKGIGSSQKRRFTMRRMTSRGVKCSPGGSLESSESFLMSSSKTRPLSALETPEA